MTSWKITSHLQIGLIIHQNGWLKPASHLSFPAVGKTKELHTANPTSDPGKSSHPGLLGTCGNHYSTLQKNGYISRKISVFKHTLGGDMLVPLYVYIYIYMYTCGGIRLEFLCLIMFKPFLDVGITVITNILLD